MLAGTSIQPAEGLLVVQYLDDHEDCESYPLPDGDYEGCLAQVLAAGPKTTSKSGQVVVLAACTNGTKLPGSSACLVSQYSVVATIKTA